MSPIDRISDTDPEKHVAKENYEIAKDELNVKEVEYLKDTSRFVSYKLKPQLKTLGPKYGAKLGKLRQFFEQCDANAVVATVKAGEIYKTEFQGDTFELALEDLLISTESASGFVSSSDKGITVVLDTQVTPELKAEGIEREIISKIQSMRKDAGFEVVDRIIVNYVTEDEDIKNAFENGKNLKSVISADSISKGSASGYEKQLDINGAVCTVIINKVNA